MDAHCDGVARSRSATDAEARAGFTHASAGQPQARGANRGIDDDESGDLQRTAVGRSALTGALVPRFVRGDSATYRAGGPRKLRLAVRTLGVRFECVERAAAAVWRADPCSALPWGEPALRAGDVGSSIVPVESADAV